MYIYKTHVYTTSVSSFLRLLRWIGRLAAARSWRLRLYIHVLYMNMYLCTHAYTYTHVFVCVFICIHIYACTCTCIHICIYVCLYMCMHPAPRAPFSPMTAKTLRLSLYIYILYIFIHIYARMHIYVNMYMYTYIHMYTYKFTCTCMYVYECPYIHMRPAPRAASREMTFRGKWLARNLRLRSYVCIYTICIGCTYTCHILHTRMIEVVHVLYKYSYIHVYFIYYVYAYILYEYIRTRIYCYI